jgi:UDPglucose 6-dehydrogenase
MSKNGSCHLNIIESVLKDLASIDYKGFIVLRSTVPVGTCDKLNCYFMPEFLTEKNFIDDFINNKDWMFGLLGKPEDEQMKEKISTLFSLAHANDRIKHNNLHFITNKEAEMVKMFKNCYLSTKVSFCNEIYQFCEQKQVNYEVVRALATADERILPSHSRVPGHDGQRGFGGTCFPKDTSSLRYEMQQANMTPYILNAIIERNELVDRPQKDWLLDKGRAAVDE